MERQERPTKPLGIKTYGSIGHLPGSRKGPGDHSVHEGQARICTETVRDRHDRIIVQEKLDGSCTGVAKINGIIIALGRAGWPADTSPYEQHQLFATWVQEHEGRFRTVLNDGERLVGEWLAQAHGTRYDLPHEPWVAFDLIAGHTRLPFDELIQRVGYAFWTPHVIAEGATSIDTILPLIEKSNHGAIDPVEGAIWRVERRGAVDFLAKYVRPDKVDGNYLPELSGNDAIWNWRPD